MGKKEGGTQKGDGQTPKIYKEVAVKHKNSFFFVVAKVLHFFLVVIFVCHILGEGMFCSVFTQSQRQKGLLFSK